MSLTQYYAATTLDGYIADPDNSLDLLFTRKPDEDRAMNYRAFIAQVGALARGAAVAAADRAAAGRDGAQLHLVCARYAAVRRPR